jgi:2-methylcitrate dehydratase PrpD
MTNNTESLAHFVAKLDYDSIPKEVVDRAKRQILDIIGVALAGSQQKAGLLAARFVQKTGGTSDCIVWGTPLRSSAPQAAFANGVSSHALDYDDRWLPPAHPTCVTLPATMAVAEANRVSGRKLLVAQTAGYEIMGKLHLFAASTLPRKSWHPTSVFGAFGAAASAGKLLDLDRSRLQIAFGIAASEASGISANMGTMAKPFHAGHGARNGVVAAMLAADGFSANLTVFDGAFFETFYGAQPSNDWQLTMSLGNPYHILNPGIGIKMYPSDGHLTFTFESALDAVTKHAITPDEVTSVEVQVPYKGNFDRPSLSTGLEGKFSYQYHVALAVLDRKATIASFQDERAFAHDIREFMKKVTIRVDPSIPGNREFMYHRVTIRLRDGREVTGAEPRPRGHWRYPLQRPEYEGKFRENASMALQKQNLEKIIEMVDHLEDLPDVRVLTDALAVRN